MKIIYTAHAQQRMAEPDRSITTQEVEATVNEPDIRRPGRGEVRVADKRIGKRRVSIVYRQEGDSIIVITAVLNKG